MCISNRSVERGTYFTQKMIICIHASHQDMYYNRMVEDVPPACQTANLQEYYNVLMTITLIILKFVKVNPQMY